ncbi:MAG: hypothetical protein HEQ39_20180 [Rhizobacter sp.]
MEKKLGNPKRGGNKKRTPEEVAQKASICLKQRENIPSAPVWHMGHAYLKDTDSHALMQNTIDYLACKAKAGMKFTDDEKEFLIELYESFWWGGSFKRYWEAAKLANHYVNGDGKEVKLDASVYKDSVIVIDAIKALKIYIVDRHKQGKFIALVKTTDHDFMRSKFAAHLLQGKRNQETQGHLIPNDGALLVEQINERLHYADNRFHLEASTSLVKDGFLTKWSIASLYDFVDFSDPKQGHFTTSIPMSPKPLLLPDGLSNHMEKIGIAKKFWYKAEWSEIWQK